eukprot:snap_masked-scaffold_2-processed-gene-3.19-mRNA-1 protein AED:0.02 eAED:0.02 QI:0/-1/0/1/-1/1/1/0/481
MEEEIHRLRAVCPLDGRYGSKTESLRTYFSEFALIKHRVEVEVEYFLYLVQLLEKCVVTEKETEEIRAIYKQFSEDDALWVKNTEKVTNHDVKAVEYFVKHKLKESGLQHVLVHSEMVHFGLTSQDVTNTAIPLMMKRFVYEEYLPKLLKVVKILDNFSNEWINIPLLARTHGQPASPTTMGKEFKVFVYRLQKQIISLDNVSHCAKFGGATGNFNAHNVAFPSINWPEVADEFISKLDLERLQFTTQIDNYDESAALFHAVARLNTILIDLCRDTWSYIGSGLFKQKTKAGEIGSSAMPHKVNPIDFENAEGNFGLSNALFVYLGSKLPISRLQRDLTDSTSTRNIGVPFGHAMVALESLAKGLNKLVIDEESISKELEMHWEVVAEGLQTILRREGVDGAYELLKEETRGSKVTKEGIKRFIKKLEKDLSLDADIITELDALTPSNYIGVVQKGESLADVLRKGLKPQSFKILGPVIED